MTNRLDEAAPVQEPPPHEGNGFYRPQVEAPKLTDRGNGMRLARDHGEDLRYCWPWKKWLAWDARRWCIDDTGELPRRAKEVVSKLFLEVADRLKELAEMKAEGEADEKRKAETAVLAKVVMWAKQSESAPRIAAMLDLARSEPGIPIKPADLDRDPFALNVANGTLDLRTGTLRDHCRDDLLTKLCPTAYRPDAVCPHWEQFLTDTFPASGDAAEQAGDVELIAYVQRLLGYGMTGDVREHVLPIFWGVGANGKSTLLNAVQDVLGCDFTMKAPPELLTVRKGEAHPTERADLFGRRLVLAIETEAGARLAESLVKELSGGDRVRARRMREDFWEFEPTHKVILCTNHKPKVRGTDYAIWRRLRLVPFRVCVPENRQDKQLGAKLRAEAEGILAWIVRGCLEWQKHGLGTAAAVTLATQEYRSEQDVVGAFVAERCHTGDTVFRCKAKDLYTTFRKWCEALGEREIGQTDFGQLIVDMEGIVRYTNNGTWYKGIALRQSDEDATEATEATEPVPG